jgi:hypothetical protein
MLVVTPLIPTNGVTSDERRSLKEEELKVGTLTEISYRCINSRLIKNIMVYNNGFRLKIFLISNSRTYE